MRRATQAAAVAFLLFGLLAAVIAVQVRRSGDASRTRARHLAEVRAVAGVAGSLDDLLDTAGQLRRSTDLYGVEQARSRFPQLARQTVSLPVATSVALEQVVPTRERASFERRSGLLIDRPPAAPKQLPSLVVTSAVSTQVVGSSLWGLDVFVDPQRRATLRSAFATGAPRATPPVSGLRRLRRGLSIYLPLTRRAGMPMPDVVGVSLDLAALGDHLRSSLAPGVQVAISEGGRSVVSTSSTARTGTGRPFSFAGRQWRLSARAPVAHSSVWLVVLAGGLVGAALLSVLAWTGMTRLVRVAAERQALAQRVGDLFAHSPLGLVLTDAEHRVAEVNPALEQLLGTPADELLGRRVLDLVDSEDRDRLSVVARELEQGRSAGLSGDIRLLRRDASSVWVQLTATPQRSSTGELTGLLVQAHDVEQRRSEREALQHLAEHDPLTGALNRRSFDERLEQHLHDHGGLSPRGALYLIDLDQFSDVNNVHGHVVGDRLLVAVADALRDCLREQDALGRLGGDEFAVLLADGEARGGFFETVADRLRHAMETVLVDAPRGTVRSSGSVGWTDFKVNDTRSADEVVDAADAVMYADKRRSLVV